MAIDVEPEPYLSIAGSCGIDVVRCDLERDELKIANADCAVFTEVLEHLHYYYVPSVLEKINRGLKIKGYLILTTPNIASLFRRLKLLLGKQPIYRHHVREYTMEEILELIKGAGFDVVESYYSLISDFNVHRCRSGGLPKGEELQRPHKDHDQETNKGEHPKNPSIPTG